MEQGTDQWLHLIKLNILYFLQAALEGCEMQINILGLRQSCDKKQHTGKVRSVSPSHAVIAWALVTSDLTSHKQAKTNSQNK